MVTMILKKPHEVRRHRRLTRTAYREITHADGGYIHGVRTQQTMVVQAMPDPHSELKQPA